MVRAGRVARRGRQMGSLWRTAGAAGQIMGCTLCRRWEAWSENFRGRAALDLVGHRMGRLSRSRRGKRWISVGYLPGGRPGSPDEVAHKTTTRRHS
jgi:hypothetical protein